MLTVIRTTPTRTKYCGRTVDNLIESNGGRAHRVIIVASNKTPNENGFDALQAGIDCSKGQPFIFLEDDLAFIRGFNQAAEDFTNLCSGVRSLILPLCANYKDALAACRGVAWRYPVSNFYGTQAFVIHPSDAEHFLRYCKSLSYMPSSGFDLLIKNWAAANHKTHFFTPHRSFVQHLGVESSLHNGRFHHYSTWPGPDWKYRCGGFSLEEQTKRPCDATLADALAEWFGKHSVVYDMGCSTGKYLQALTGHGIPCKGFDATPGIERADPPIEELDLSRPQKFSERPANVMCLEVAEHIHAEDEPHFIANITTLCRDKLALSWAVPGQGGRRHVNEQTAAIVIEKMNAVGFKYDGFTAQKLRAAAQIKWFKESLYAFTRQKA